MCGSECCEKLVMSSVGKSMCVSGWVEIGLSCMKRLKTVGEITDPCGTLLWKHLFVEACPTLALVASAVL